VAWASVSQGDGRLYAGGLAVHALLAAVVIRAATGSGPLPTALSLRPLRWLGGISYGAYLYHWPLFLWLTPERTGLDGLPLAGLRIATSLGLAAASYRLLEEPIRTGRRLTPDVARVAAAGGALAVAVAAFVVVPHAPPDEIAVVTDAPALVAPEPVASASPSTTSTTLAPHAVRPWLPGERLQIYVAGDSNAYTLGMALRRWAEGREVDVWVSGWFACHLVRGGEYRYAGQDPKPTEQKCNDWPATRAAELARIRPHVTLVVNGLFDVLDRRLSGSRTWRHVGEPGFDGLLRREIERMTDLALDAGSRVVWATYPLIKTGTIEGVPPRVRHPENDPARIEALNGMIRQVAKSRPAASVLEYRQRMQQWPEGELDPERRPDGVHPTKVEVTKLAWWAGQQLESVATRP